MFSLRSSARSALNGGPSNAEKSELFSHRQEFEFYAVNKLQIKIPRRYKPARLVKLNSRQGRHNLQATKSFCASFILAPRQNRARNSLARVFRMDEEGPNLRKLASRIEIPCISRRILIASEQSLSLTPSTATDQHP